VNGGTARSFEELLEVLDEDTQTLTLSADEIGRAAEVAAKAQARVDVVLSGSFLSRLFERLKGESPQ
jgi:hypothetical protein